MKNLQAMLIAATLLLAVAGIPSAVSADEAGKAPDAAAVLKAIEAAGKPGEAHQKLQPLAGEWTYTSKFWMDPSQPPMEASGTIERKWILGGRFLEERIVGKGPDGKSDFEGRGTIGYDNNQGKYTYNWICSMGTCSSNSLGTLDESDKQFTFEAEVFCPVRNEKVQTRDELRIESNDKHVMESYQDVDGKEVKVMEFTAVRKK